MFYEVRVFDSKNKIKRIISGQQLSRKYWDKFETNFNISSTKPKKVKKKLATKSNQLKNINRDMGTELTKQNRIFEF